MYRLLIPIIACLLLTACSIPEPLVERVKTEGVLRVITWNSPTTYYIERDEIKGLEYELVERFARELGVKVQYILPESFDQIIPSIQIEDAHFAAAGLIVTPERKSNLKFTPSYLEITQQLVYRSGSRRPRKIMDTTDGLLEVMAGSIHEESLQKLKLKNPGLEWVSQKEHDTSELLYLIEEQLVDYTIANSNEVSMSRRFYPHLKGAFDLGSPQPVAWAFPHAEDSSLYHAAKEFLEKIKKNGTLDQLIERYYGSVDRLNFVDTLTFRRHYGTRLQELLPFFHRASEETGIDWQRVAAIGYQESHWNPKAVSPTGVRGVMMLTKATAKQLKIKDRMDPKQSILGGAKYVRLMKKKVPNRIQEPDRLWLALAGYNVGFGHLEDARILTERTGDDPDKWADVKRYLPLLSQKKYYTTVKRGYARGGEPVHYVDNIRSYYDLLMFELEKTPENSRSEQQVFILGTPSAL